MSEYAKLDWGSKWPVPKSSCNEGKINFLCHHIMQLLLFDIPSVLPLIQCETIPDQAESKRAC